MKFHEWESLFEFAQNEIRKRGGRVPDDGWKELYPRFIARNISAGWSKTLDGILGIWRQQSEFWWYEASRPYYKVWPAIQQSLLGLNLDVDAAGLCLQPRTILIRFAIGREPVKSAGAILVAVRDDIDAKTRELTGGRSLCVSWGEEKDRTHRNACLSLEKGKTVEQAILEGYQADVMQNVEKNDARLILRCAITVNLLADDPSIITPDVLAKDRDRYDHETDEAWKQRAVERAKRRGVVGWNIGADYEVCPHYRRPHFGLRHTGKGRTVPRIVPIKGAVVHRSRLTEVPTGYQLPDGTEIEHGKVVSNV